MRADDDLQHAPRPRVAQRGHRRAERVGRGRPRVRARRPLAEEGEGGVGTKVDAAKEVAAVGRAAGGVAHRRRDLHQLDAAAEAVGVDAVERRHARDPGDLVVDVGGVGGEREAELPAGEVAARVQRAVVRDERGVEVAGGGVDDAAAATAVGTVARVTAPRPSWP